MFVSFFGVFLLCGVFVEVGVFGLNENKMLIFCIKIILVYKIVFGIYIGGIVI